MKPTLLVTLLGISTSVFAVEPDLSSEVDAAFKRLSDAQNYSYRMSTRMGEQKYEEYFSGRISREKGAVWGMLDVISGGPPTVTIVAKDGRGVLEVENQWMTLGDLFTEPGVLKNLKYPRDGMKTVINILTTPPLPSGVGLIPYPSVETFSRDADRYVGQISKRYVGQISKEGEILKEQLPDGAKATFWVEVVNGMANKWGTIQRIANPGPTGGERTGDWVVEISDVGTTKLEVPEGARARLDKSEDRQAEQGGADQPATAPKSKSEGNEKTKPESEGRSQ
jgi:hypothetical protein